MEIITKQSIIANVAEAFKDQYYSKGWSTRCAFRSEYTYEQIYHKLLEAKTEEDVSSAIGNDSWTRNKCHECGLDCDTVIVLGEEPDYESNTAQICPSCIKKAVDLVNGHQLTR
jgi:hypothetical protein